MSSQNLVVLGASDDPHIDSVKKDLLDFNVKTLPIWHDQVFSNKVYLENENLFVDGVTEVAAIWNRSKIQMVSSNTQQESANDFLLKACWSSFYKFIMAFCDYNEIPIFNYHRSKYNSKIIDLTVAQKAGFTIPTFIIPTSVKGLLNVKYWHGAKDLVIKTLDFPYAINEVGQKEVVFAQTISHEEIKELQDDEINIAPQFLQEKILKKSELRVICTLTDIHTYELKEQSSFKESITDWRVYSNIYGYNKTSDFDKQLFDKCKNFLEYSGLIYGVFDFVVDVNDNIYFLECNPEGQWYSLQSQHGDEISKSIARVISQRFFKAW